MAIAPTLGQNGCSTGWNVTFDPVSGNLMAGGRVVSLSESELAALRAWVTSTAGLDSVGYDTASGTIKSEGESVTLSQVENATVRALLADAITRTEADAAYADKTTEDLAALAESTAVHAKNSVEALAAKAVTAEVDPVTGVVELSTGEGVISKANLAPNAMIDGRFLSGQPYGITRPVRNTGKLVTRFKASEWSTYSTATLSEHTGYDESGNVNGVVSRTGHPTMLKMACSDNSNEGVYCTNVLSTFKTRTLNGKFGVWLYIDKQPGFDTPSPSNSLSCVISTNPNGSSANGMTITWNTNIIKEGWNFVTFIMRNPAAYLAGAVVSEDQPYGLSVALNGTGADTDILNNPVTVMDFSMSGTPLYTDAGNFTSVYWDSIWTDFDTLPQIVMGYDTTDQSIIDYALPIFEEYGWKGYFTVNGGYWDGIPANRILSDYTNNTGSYPLRINKLKAAGWDAVNHGLMHLPGTQTSPKMAELTSAAEIAYELMANYGVMRSLGLTKGTEFYATPQGSTSRLAEKVIAGCGFKAQRASRGPLTHVTPWGVPNPHHIGSPGLGGRTAPVLNEIKGVNGSNSTTSVTNMNQITNVRRLVDLAIVYGATMIVFAHGIETVGDDGSGMLNPSDDTNCFESLHRLFMQYVKEKEDAGLLRVRDGFTGFYYGVGR